MTKASAQSIPAICNGCVYENLPDGTENLTGEYMEGECLLFHMVKDLDRQ